MVTTRCVPLSSQLSIIPVPAFTAPRSLAARPVPGLPPSSGMEQRVQHPRRELVPCLPWRCREGAIVTS